MPVVDIAIGKRNFQLVCGEGQESHLQSLAVSVSEKVEVLSESMGNTSDTLLLVMASLMLQDELDELRAEIKEQDNEDEATDDAVAEAIEKIADYVEEVANTLAKV